MFWGQVVEGQAMKLFISYDHDDISRVEELASYLKHAGHDAWYDHELLPGQKWETELKTQVESCDVFIYVVSRDSLKSEWCKREHRIAKKAKIAIIPVLIDIKAVSLMKKELGEIQYSDFCEGFKSDRIAKLMGGLTKIAEDLAIKKARKTLQTAMKKRNSMPLKASSELESAIAPLMVEIQGIKSQLVENLGEQVNEYLEAENWEKAIKKIIELARYDTQNATVYACLGWAYYQIGNKDEAKLNYNEAIQLDPQFAAVYINRGNLYREKGQLENALADYDGAIQLNTRFPLGYINRGNLYRDKGQLEDALADFNMALLLNPKEVLAYRGRCILLYEMQRKEEALQDSEIVCDLSQDESIDQNNRAFLLFQLGRYQESEVAWKKSIELKDAGSYAFAGYAIVSEYLKKSKEVLAQYQLAINLDKRWKNDLEAIAKEYLWTDEMIELARGILKRLGV